MLQQSKILKKKATPTLRKIQLPAETHEDGFTLIEILVVILIIGILTSIAIPVFLNQRKVAVDASVTSDVKSVVTAIETGIIENSDATNIENIGPSGVWTSGGNQTSTTVCFKATPTATCVLGVKTMLSNGVVIDISGTPNSYLVTGWHPNGSKYTSVATNLRYKSAEGGLEKL